MSGVFWKVLNMSAAAGWLIGAVVILRLLLKKSPRWAVCLLWAAVAVRLVCPFSFESPVSLIPDTEPFSAPVIVVDASARPDAGPAELPAAVGQSAEPVPSAAERGMDGRDVLPVVWMAGLLVLGGCAMVSYLRLRRRVAAAVRLQDDLYQSENVDSPFVLGLIRPNIYLPFHMEDGQMAHVIRHERAHIARLDHWWKPLGYGIVMLHWFNPLVWLGYILFCRDLELACDEKAVRELDGPGRADYIEALLRCSLSRRSVTACPLAFGEVGVKARVKSILNYRRPVFWAVALAAAACIIVGVCFLTDPVTGREFAMAGTNVRDLEPQSIVERIENAEDVSNSGIYVNADQFELHLNGEFSWADSQTVRYFYYRSGQVRSGQLRLLPEQERYLLTGSQPWTEQSRIYTLRNYLDAVKYLPQAELAALCPGADGYILRHVEEGAPADYDRVISYGPDGAGEIDGWYIHLQVLPTWNGVGTAEDAVEVFYGGRSSQTGLFCWYDRNTVPLGGESVALEAFPGVTFYAPGCSISAVATDPETGAAGASVLLSGMPIVDAYFCDVTGDGYPEICVTSYFGSGLIDERIQIYDYALGQRWVLTERGSYDYRLLAGEDCLYAERRPIAEETVLNTEKLVFRNGVLMLDDGTEFVLYQHQITAEVTGYHGNALLVRPVYGTPGLSPDTEYCVPMDENLLTSRPRAGDTVVVTYDGTVRELYPPELSGAEVLYVMGQTQTELRPMVFAGGAVYMDTGRSVPAEIEESAVLGTIISAVPSDECPTEEGQSNFGCEGSRYARFKEGIVVELGGEWYYFEPLTQDDPA